MRLESSEIPKSLALSCLVGVGYYAIATHNKLFVKEVIHSQLLMHAVSTCAHTTIQTKWDSPHPLNAMDILPIAFIMITKVQEVSWKTQCIVTTVLALPQIAITKSLMTQSPSSPSEIKWLSNRDMLDYYDQIRKLPTRSQKPQLLVPYSGKLEALWETFEGLLNWQPHYRELLLPLHVTGNHWTLIYINRDKRTVEYYDSKQNYGNFKEITSTLRDCAQKLSEKYPDGPLFTFESKIQKRLQPDWYQCGVWVLYFMEELYKNPDVDFNQLDVSNAQTMIANYRKQLIPHFVDWKN